MSANRPAVATLDALSRVPETDVIPTSGWASRVDVPKVLTWLLISFIALGILGWTIGLSIDQPISNVFAAIGLVVMLGLLIIAVIVFRRSFPSAVPRAIGALRRQLFAPINGDRRETWTSVAVAISCGSAFGSLSGYILGYSMADFITEFLITLVIVGITGILVSFLISLPFLYCLELFLGKKKKKPVAPTPFNPPPITPPPSTPVIPRPQEESGAGAAHPEALEGSSGGRPPHCQSVTFPPDPNITIAVIPAPQPESIPPVRAIREPPLAQKQHHPP